MTRASIVHAYSTPYMRHPGAGTTTRSVMMAAVRGLLEESGTRLEDVDGLGVASFTLKPDHAVDLAWRLGMAPRWLAEDPHGGVSGAILLRNAVRAIEAGDARTIVLVAGDHFRPSDFTDLVRNYNSATRNHLADLEHGGPNAVFAMLTQRQREQRGISEEELGQIPVAQRWWAQENPRAAYRSPLTLEEYLAAPIVFDPLRRLDCVPVVTGADALLVRANPDGPGVELLAQKSTFNADQQQGGGLLGDHLSFVGTDLFDAAGMDPLDIDLAGIYDDYPAMVVEQALALGLVPGGDVHRFLAVDIAERALPLNTSGGQLSAGQAGCAGGMHFLAEAVLQLLGRTPGRQVDNARHALVSTYGMVLYRFGAGLTGTILRRTR